AVPTGDVPGAIHGEEPIILDAFKEQTVTQVGLGEPSLQDGSITLPQKSLTERCQQIGIQRQSGSGNGNLLDSLFPQPLRRNSQIPGLSLQGQGFGIMAKDLARDQSSQLLTAQGERNRYMSQSSLVLYHRHFTGPYGVAYR